MKSNMPVTQIEHALNDKATLLSTTDKESHITYANSAFIDASGFNEHQLMGEPHNIIRHPDMPPAAFADMWYTLQQGDSWTGMVKNRRQNGDHYWVRANVTPVWHNEKLTGYISVRTVPSRDEITQSESLYQKINNQQLKGFRLFKGIIIRRGILSWASMFKWLSISQRVNYSLGVIALLAVLFLFAPVNPFIQAGGLLFLFLMLAIYLKYQICQPVNTLLTQMKKVVSGRKPDNCHLNRVDEIGMLMRLVNQSGLNLNSLVDDVSTQISGIRAISQRVSKEGTALHKRSEETSADLQQTAAAIEEIGSAVQQTAETAAHTMTMADKTSANAAEGGDIMKQTIAMMQAISRDNGQIVDIIGVIDSIAFQTNILALNAAVEAARAGAQGRGFAVVASEVRTLAQKSAVAAKDIESLIAQSVSSVKNGAQLVNRSGEVIDSIISSVNKVHTLMEQISVASEEQSRGIGQVGQAVTEMDGVTQQNAALVQQSAAAAASLEEQAQQLSQSISSFSLPATA